MIVIGIAIGILIGCYFTSGMHKEMYGNYKTSWFKNKG